MTTYPKRWRIKMDVFTPIIGLLGVVIGAGLSYLISVRLIDVQLRKQESYSFISRSFLPLIGALTNTIFAGHMWAHCKDNSESPFTEDETRRVYNTTLKLLQEALDSFIESGTLMLIKGVDAKLFDYILGIRYQLSIQLAKRNAPEELDEEETFRLPNVEHIIELKRRLEALTIPSLVRQYERQIKSGML